MIQFGRSLCWMMPLRLTLDMLLIATRRAAYIQLYVAPGVMPTSHSWTSPGESRKASPEGPPRLGRQSATPPLSVHRFLISSSVCCLLSSVALTSRSKLPLASTMATAVTAMTLVVISLRLASREMRLDTAYHSRRAIL